MEATVPVVSWELQALREGFTHTLEAQNRSPMTIKSYREAVTQFGLFLARAGMVDQLEDIRRQHVEAFITEQLARFKPATAANRYRSLAVFFKWCISQNEIEASPMAAMKPPTIPEAPPPVLTDQGISALLRACDGRSFDDRRDLAIIRVLIDTGMRRAELAGLMVSDVDFDHRTATVVGKGQRTRVVGLGHKSVLALLRYMRERQRHRDAHLPNLWLGRWGAMTPDGIAHIVERRAGQAGLKDVHPHTFRHTFAHQWRVNGGNDSDLMAFGGWRSPQMLQRYGASAAAQRAREAHRRLSPGDRY